MLFKFAIRIYFKQILYDKLNAELKSIIWGLVVGG